DAVSGVRAGVAGGFGLVVGVARGRADTHQAAALREAGADVVVGALSELRCERDGVSLKALDTVPAVWERQAELAETLSARRLAVFLDYDGTLSPIVEDYTKAVLSQGMRDTVARLARRHPVAIISGRDLANLRELVGLESVYYAGSHGFDLAGPDGRRTRLGEGEKFVPDLDAAERALRQRLSGIEGHAVERKAFAIAVHYRRVPDAHVSRVESLVDEVVAAHAGLRKGHGKKVFQVQPDTDWDKGRALTWLLDHLGLDDPGVLPIYIGDDLTDEDAFRALCGRGLGVVLRDGRRNTSADCALTDPSDVQRFLEFLIATGGSPA
ncbi:MAG: trehalose-phosphatase, partial [Gammaproteobacteria bacterium]|nr:trehalose-phosphatase [Gammaproteobacteria bacterium]